ncbi:hypothetical protein CRG98_038976 [Punica granatum]|uniref:Uncharacterized protein n=1 Tax=Punica granatum TaxID=22663 RepID=A0A2I0I9F7_PUNGR|nr:hypothetical protein CRG98_038976 [Punica granatum]
MDYVCIDEVQDLTMRQIGLFKYVSHNVEEGFVFSGDPAQTIERGIDYKSEDVQQLFYNDFMQEIEGGGKISKICQLSLNFRTHSGILKLAQSVTDLLCHFFPLFCDVLSVHVASGAHYRSTCHVSTDVVLYNLFGSSPMKNQWRIVYKYMKGRKLLDNSFISRYPQFKPARHNILCSELKQLYVAVTRARQRLWICENNG